MNLQKKATSSRAWASCATRAHRGDESILRDDSAWVRSHLTPTAKGHAPDSCHDGQPAGLDGGHDREKVGRAARGVPVGHLLDVCPGAEGLPPSRDDHERHRIVILRLLQPSEDAHAYVVAKRVQGRLA